MKKSSKTSLNEISIGSKIIIVLLVINMIFNHFNFCIILNAFSESKDDIIYDNSIMETTNFNKDVIL